MSSTHSITYITSGAAGMYCGSCMHDNTLARALNQLGCETILVPTYTPIRTDEEDATIDQVFFGGINVYLQQKMPLFRHLPRFLDRVLDRPSLIRRVTQRAIETDASMLGELTVSMLKGNHGNQRKEVRRLVHWLRQTAHPSVVILSNVLIGGCIEFLKQQLNVPVVVTLQGDDIFLESLQEPHKSQAIQMIGELDRDIDAYLLHSHYYADFMADYLHLDRSKMHITPLGIDTSDFVNLPAGRPNDRPTVGYLARLTKDKGLHVLVDAFIELKNDPSMRHAQLVIAGWLGEDHKAFAREQFEKLTTTVGQDSFRYLGAIERDQKLEMLQTLDVLSVPTVYREPKGLYVLESLAAGVPVVQPAHGVFPELIEQSGGGVLFPPENASELASQLANLLTHHEQRRQLGIAGRDHVFEKRNAHVMAERTLEIINGLVQPRSAG